MASSPPGSTPTLTGERAAQALRFALGLGTGPIDIFDVIEQRRVEIAFRDLDGDDGRYIFHNGVALILVTNHGVEASRQRFTAAHELGHHEMHRFAADNEEADSFSVIDRNIAAPGQESIEVEANAFAAELLLPAAYLQSSFGGSRTVTLTDIGDVMRRYRTSFQATLFRFQNAGIIKPAERQHLAEEGKGRVKELRGSDDPPTSEESRPLGFERSLLALYRGGIVSAARVSEQLGIPENEIADRYGEPTGASEADPSHGTRRKSTDA